jgi:glycolate oxidase FAD binding subunit
VSPPITLDDLVPLQIVQPKSVADLSETVREAMARGQAIYPVGGRTRLHIGRVPTKPGIAVELTGLAGIEDYPARDMTVTVRAGTTLAAVQAELAKENQYLPIDVPSPDRATLGGSLAANVSGPRRFSHGTFRDAVIGIRFVADSGIEVKGGGRVVKNVAGYDLMKLHIGAFGTLGIITQVTLKVKPRPEANGWISFGVNAAAVGPTLDRLHSSASRPTAIELLNAKAAKKVAERSGIPLPEVDPWVILCGFEEKATTVEWQMLTLLEELRGAPVRHASEHSGPGAVAIWSALTQLQDAGTDFATIKGNVLPSSTAGFAEAAAALHPDAVVHAHAGNGIVWCHLPEELGLDRFSTGFSALVGRTQPGNANAIVHRCPTAWKNRLAIWGRDRGDREPMQQLKRTLDPMDLLNPGRFL